MLSAPDFPFANAGGRRWKYMLPPFIGPCFAVEYIESAARPNRGRRGGSALKAKDEEMKQDNPHAKHRQRLRERFLSTGLEGFQDHEILELALFYVYSRRDTNPIGHALIERFGSLSGVLDAPVEALRRVPGVGPQAAVFLKLLPALFARYESSKYDGVTAIGSPQEDMMTTQALEKTLLSMGVTLMDHIVVADGDYVSFAESGFLLKQRMFAQLRQKNQPEDSTDEI